MLKKERAIIYGRTNGTRTRMKTTEIGTESVILKQREMKQFLERRTKKNRAKSLKETLDNRNNEPNRYNTD